MLTLACFSVVALNFQVINEKSVFNSKQMFWFQNFKVDCKNGGGGRNIQMNYSPVWTMKKNKKALQLCRKNEIKEKAAHHPCILCINFRSFCNVFQHDINKYTTTTTLTNYPQLP